jgi:Trk K+ transport system NAD-binding subunit
LKRPGEGDEDVIVPAADTVIHAGDQLLILGSEAAVRRLADA